MRNHTEQLNEAARLAQNKGNPLVLWPEDMKVPCYQLNAKLPVLGYDEAPAGWTVTHEYHPHEQPAYRTNYAYARLADDTILEYAREN